jgi:hypothetical protein
MPDPKPASNARTVAVFNPEGELGTIDASELSQAVNQGNYRVASPEEVKDYNDQQKYGEGAGNSIKAFGYGAARSATFGLSDQFLTKAGMVAPSELAGLEKHNPVSNFAGEAAGVVGALAMPEGEVAGAIGEGAGAGLKAADVLNPVRGISKVGKAVSEGVAPAAGEITSLVANPETSPIAHKILSQAGSHALGSAVEGAAYGLGQSVSEQALGDPDLNAEKVMSNIGYGALFGGALGGALKAGEIGVPEAVGKAGDALQKLKENIFGAQGEIGPVGKAYAKASSFVSGKPEESILEALKDKSRSLINPEEQTELATSFAKNLDEQYTSLNKATIKASNEVRPLESADLVKGVGEEAATTELGKVAAKMQDVIGEMESQPELYPKMFPTKLKQFYGSLEKAMTEGGEPANIYNTLNELKQNLDKGLKFGKIPTTQEMDSISAIRGLRSEIKASLENESVWGEAGARQSAYNDAINEHLAYKKEFEKAFMKKGVSRSGSVVYKIDPSKVNSFFGQINDARGAAKAEVLQNFLNSSERTLGEIERTYKAVPSKSFDKDAVQSVLEKNKSVSDEAMKQAAFSRNLSALGGGGHNAYLGEGAAIALGVHNPVLGSAIEGFTMLRNPGLAVQRLAKLEKMANETSRAIAKGAKSIFNAGVSAVRVEKALLIPQMAKQQQEKDKVHERVAHDVSMMMASPETMVSKLEDATKEMYQNAPRTAQSLQAQASVATQFLAGKLPSMPPKRPLSMPYKVSQAEVSKFMKYYETVENPVSVLGHVKNCTISQEHMETLQTVFPKLLTEMKSQVMSELVNFAAKKKEHLPYSRKMALSLFLDQDLDDSLAQASIAANQVSMNMSLQADNQQPQAQGPVRPTQKGLSGLEKSNQMLTAMQTVSQRGQQS